jgi:hypothetical protein
MVKQMLEDQAAAMLSLLTRFQINVPSLRQNDREKRSRKKNSKMVGPVHLTPQFTIW